MTSLPDTEPNQLSYQSLVAAIDFGRERVWATPPLVRVEIESRLERVYFEAHQLHNYPTITSHIRVDHIPDRARRALGDIRDSFLRIVWGFEIMPTRGEPNPMTSHNIVGQTLINGWVDVPPARTDRIPAFTMATFVFGCPHDFMIDRPNPYRGLARTECTICGCTYDRDSTD